ncbi:TPA: PIN domain-containing protein [Candidatus Bathyarchaeota archaeon]|nr:PIN domain-containing protein [Candidatus Bathyarchaeota archaeon]
MKGEIAYLDSSALVKRYVKELGSNAVREAFLKAYSGDLALSFNVWNVGEVLGAFDKAKRTKRIDGEAYNIVRGRFLLETRRMMRLGFLTLVPLKFKILKDSWGLIEKFHIYAADAVQVASAKYVSASCFMTGDEQLYKVALKEGLNSIHLG